jgi:hypothetical protein
MGQFGLSCVNPRFGTKKIKTPQIYTKIFMGKNKKFVSNDIDWDTK